MAVSWPKPKVQVSEIDKLSQISERKKLVARVMAFVFIWEFHSSYIQYTLNGTLWCVFVCLLLLLLHNFCEFEFIFVSMFFRVALLATGTCDYIYVICNRWVIPVTIMVLFATCTQDIISHVTSYENSYSSHVTKYLTLLKVMSTLNHFNPSLISPRNWMTGSGWLYWISLNSVL